MVRVLRLIIKTDIKIYICCFSLLASCNLFLTKKKVDGKYYHRLLRDAYTLTLSNGEFTQKFNVENDKIKINKGRYTIESEYITFTFWKTQEELKSTDSNKGGCAGCGAKFINDQLQFYDDPDSYPVDEFIKSISNK